MSESQPLTLVGFLGNCCRNVRVCANLVGALVLIFKDDKGKIDLDRLGITLGKLAKIFPCRPRLCDALNSTLNRMETKQEKWIEACSKVGCMPICDPQWVIEIGKIIGSLRTARHTKGSDLNEEEIFSILNKS